jgi:proteasome accessory factor B
MSISRVYRLLRLITMLQSRANYNAEQLAAELEVSRRTVFRDLNMLEMAHIPYYFDPQTGGYHISRHFFLPPVNLTLTEALAMLLLAGRAGGSRPVPLLAEAGRAALKLENALPRAIAAGVGTLLDRLSVSTGPLSRHEALDEVFDDLRRAVVERRVCRLVYISFDERKQIKTQLRPLRLRFQGRAWYVIGYSTKHREVRTFKLGRIRKLALTPRTFTEPADVELGEYFGQAWSMIPEGRLYDVHLHFEPKVAGNVAEVRWHESQRVEWNDDGSIEFRVTVDGISEITWWILGYGDQVEVVSPAALRRRVGTVAAAVARKHRKGGR